MLLVIGYPLLLSYKYEGLLKDLEPFIQDRLADNMLKLDIDKDTLNSITAKHGFTLVRRLDYFYDKEQLDK